MSDNETVGVRGRAYIGTETQSSGSTRYVLGMDIYVDADAPARAGQAHVEVPISKLMYQSLHRQLMDSDAEEARISVEGKLELIVRGVSLN